MKKKLNKTEQPVVIEGFDIADEFRITDEMENGKRYDLTKDAYIVVRSFQSKTYLKGIQKLKTDNPDLEPTDLLILACAEYGIVDIKEISIDSKMVENTKESKLKALKYGATKNGNGPFLTFLLRKAQVKNFEGAGKSLDQTA